jgi:hypothetical protein
MEHRPLRSSTVASAGYDSATMRLEIAFRNGSLYEYSNVPEMVFDGLMAATSAGKYLNQYIKKANYPFRQLR